MTLIEARTVSLPSSQLVKMEERKRRASQDDDSAAPPLKRHATSKEEKSRKRDDGDLPGGADIERFRKEAIYRQMLEFKREKQMLEGRLQDAVKLANNRDEYIRKTDAFAEQLVDVCRIRKTHKTSVKPYQPVPGELLSSNDFEAFEKYMTSRASSLKDELESIFAQDESLAPEKQEIEQQLEALRNQEKNAFMEMEKARQERDQMIQRLETATSRYMIAEKKLDRAKSTSVIKMEQQAIASSRPEATNSNEAKEATEQTNGVSVDSEALVRAEEARLKAEASLIKQKELLDNAVTENEKLNSRLTAAEIKSMTPSEDDFAASELFKHLRTQHEEVIKRVNDLEATNIELRKEAQRLQADRTSFKSQVEIEHQSSLNEKDLQLGRMDADLARIRSARDELHAKFQTLDSNEELERTSIEQLKKVVEALEDRNKALEVQMERQSGEPASAPTVSEGMSEEEVRKKYETIRQQYDVLNQELQGFGQAYQKLQSSTMTKINNQIDHEERVKRAVADKNKADQRYFAAMKLKDTMNAEIRALKAQSSKNSDLITGLRDAEQASKALCQTYDLQLSKLNEMVEQLNKHKSKLLEETSGHTTALADIKKQLEDTKEAIISRDSTIAETKSAKRKAEVEITELKAVIEERDKRIEASKKKGSSADNETLEMLRTLAMCTVCRKNFKDTALKTCGHTMCSSCAEERITSRSRKCPHCNRAFSRNDSMRITLN